MYGKLNKEILKRLERIVSGRIVDDPEKMKDYGGDEFSDPSIRKIPQAVLKPKNSREISEILKLANQEKIPVTPRGGGTGLTGGCVPLYGGIVISTEEMKDIVEIDTENMMATVEAGVTLRDFYAEVEKTGLFFPPHPGEEGAHFGGLISSNASGARSVRYGGVRNYVKSIEVVLPQGEITNIGGKYTKTSTGYSLLNLMIGSEGTLGIITKAVIALQPKPKAMYTLVIPYNDLQDAIRTVPEIRKVMLPMAVEFIEHEVIPPTEKLIGKSWPCHAKAYLMIIVDCSSDEEALQKLETVGSIALECGAAIKSVDELSIADTKKRQDDVLAIRSNIYLALKKIMVEALDICVPPAKTAEYISKVNKIADKYATWGPNYGHAADGNIHTHIMKVNSPDMQLEDTGMDEWKEKYPAIRREIYEVAKELGGIVSGEHGIGIVKKEYLPMFIEPVQIELMKGIKRLLDPNNILNPGKIFDL